MRQYKETNWRNSFIKKQGRTCSLYWGWGHKQWWRLRSASRGDNVTKDGAIQEPPDFEISLVLWLILLRAEFPANPRWSTHPFHFCALPQGQLQSTGCAGECHQTHPPFRFQNLCLEGIQADPECQFSRMCCGSLERYCCLFFLFSCVSYCF